jgi:hypothetical protein
MILTTYFKIELYFRKFRNVCSMDLDKKNLKIGGRSYIVQIDETLAAKVKYNSYY